MDRLARSGDALVGYIDAAEANGQRELTHPSTTPTWNPSRLDAAASARPCPHT
jgi:hypothetical protein